MAIKDLSELKVALVHENLASRGGAEKVLTEMRKLFPAAPIYTAFYKPELFPELAQATVIASGISRWGFFRNRHQLLAPIIPYLFEQFDLSDYDLVISISTGGAKGVLTRPETLHVCYCNTPMRWAWMPYLDRRASGSPIRRWAAHYLRIWDVASLPRVDAWIGNSVTIVNRIKKFYKVEAAVVYPPIAVSAKEPSTTDKGFYLTVSRLEDQKRIDVIVEAAKLAKVPLKVVGKGPLLSALQAQAAGHSNIEFLGYVSDEEKDRLYRDCKAFLFASEEDFGIVPVEAMSFGKPVIAYGKGGGSETVIDQKTGLHFTEQTPESLASTMKTFDTMTFDAAAIAKHAQQFSAEEFRANLTHFLQKAWRDHTS